MEDKEGMIAIYQGDLVGKRCFHLRSQRIGTIKIILREKGHEDILEFWPDVPFAPDMPLCLDFRSQFEFD